MSETPHMKNSAPPVTVGISSLFAVLIILCLTVFAILARLSAEDERKLAEKAAESITAYYLAEYRANERLAQMQSEIHLYEIGDTMGFTEAIDQNRELRVSLLVTEDGIVRLEWAAAAAEKPDELTPEQNTGGGLALLIFDEEE